MNLSLSPIQSLNPAFIRQHVLNLIICLKRRRLWKCLDLPTRGWLELAASLRGIKFRSRQVLLVLVKIMAKLKPFLSLTNFFRTIGISRAWRNSMIAEEWGNSLARVWRSDVGYQIYCGLTEFYLARVIPRDSHQLELAVPCPSTKALLSKFMRIIR